MENETFNDKERVKSISEIGGIVKESWKNLPKNIMQNRRYKQDISKKARVETRKILERLLKNPDYIKSVKMPRGDVPASLTREKEAFLQLFERIKKVRLLQAKKEGIVQKF